MKDMKQFIVAPAPHAHGGDSVRRNMLWVILALLPAYAVSVLEFGWGALITAAISVCVCVLTEWVISHYLLKEHKQTIGDLSAVLTDIAQTYGMQHFLCPGLCFFFTDVFMGKDRFRKLISDRIYRIQAG